MMKEYRFDQIAIVSTEKKKPSEEDRANYVGLEHLSPDTFDVTEYGSEVAPKGDKLVMRKGDVLFGKRRAYQKKVGIAPCDGIFSAHGMVLRPNEDVVDSRFFPFFIKSDCFLDEAIRISVGSLSPTVNWRDLRELRFNLPSLERQRELAELLWAGEGLTSTSRQLLFACDEQVKSRFVEMFVNDDFPIVQLGDYCVNINNGMARRGNDPDGSIVLRLVELQEGFLDYSSVNRITLTDKERARYLLHDGDLLFARVNGNPDNVGRCATFFDVGEPVFHNDHIIRASIASNDFEPSYLTCFINGAQGREQIKTSLKTSAGQYTINQDGIKGIRLPKPPLTLQQDFAAFVQQVDKSELL